MAAQAKVKPVNPHHLTAKQLAADRANLVKARAAAKAKPRTAKQKAASRQNLVKARAAQKARRSGKSKVTAKAAKAANPQLDLGVTGQPPAEIDCGLYLLPSCAPVALAEHLAFWAGVTPGLDEIYTLHEKSSGQLTLAELLELVSAEGFGGMRLESYRRCDPDEAVPGWLYGLDTRLGYHAVLALPGGMASWGEILPLAGQPREAWHLEWAAPLSWYRQRDGRTVLRAWGSRSACVHHLWLQFLHVLGVDNASGKWYLFWSGFVGDVTLLAAILVAPYVQWKRNNCQVKRCWRFGRHPFTDGGVTRHLCWRHHPDVAFKQFTVRHLQEKHHLYVGKQPGKG